LKKYLHITILASLLSCEDCQDCMNYDHESYVNVQFLNQSDSALINVAILEFNNQQAEAITFFSDTTSSFLFPLSMNEDESHISFVYSLSPDFQTVKSDSLVFTYSRSLVRDERNYVNVVCTGTQLVFSTLNQSVFVCRDTLGICNSNESVLRIFL